MLKGIVFGLGLLLSLPLLAARPSAFNNDLSVIYLVVIVGLMVIAYHKEAWNYLVRLIKKH